MNSGRIFTEPRSFSIQLFRETLSEKSTKLHKPIPKGSMGRSIELLHVLNTNEI